MSKPAPKHLTDRPRRQPGEKYDRAAHLKLVKGAQDARTAAPLHEHTPEQSAFHRAAAIARATRNAAPLTFTFTVNTDVAPALRSAIDELCDMIGGRLTGARAFGYEDALTCAAQALGPLRAAIYAQVPEGDARYAA